MTAIRTRRLELVWMSPAFLEALLESARDDAARVLGAELPGDWPDAHDAGFLRLRLDQVRREPERAPWLPRALVLRESAPAMIGHAGFHGPPGVNGLGREGAVEVGYTVFPTFRGRGFAAEAVSALLEWAENEHGVDHFIASVGPDNAPSLAIVRNLGFAQTGEQWDEEERLELIFERRNLTVT